MKKNEGNHSKDQQKDQLKADSLARQVKWTNYYSSSSGSFFLRRIKSIRFRMQVEKSQQLTQNTVD